MAESQLELTKEEAEMLARQNILANQSNPTNVDPMAFKIEPPENFGQGLRNFAQNVIVRPLQERLGLRESAGDVATRFLMQQRKQQIENARLSQVQSSLDLLETARQIDFFNNLSEEEAAKYNLSPEDLALARVAPQKAFAQLSARLGAPTSYDRVDTGNQIQFFRPGGQKPAFSIDKGMTPDQIRDNAAADAAVQREIKKSGREGAANIRKEFNTLTKEDREAAKAFGKLKESAALGTAKGDVALIISFAKVLDPGSVVREGEFATIADSIGVPERIVAFFNRARAGERMSNKERLEVVRAARRNLQPSIDSFLGQYNRYKDILTRSGYSVEDNLYNPYDGIQDIEAYSLFSDEELIEISQDVNSMSTKEFKELQKEIQRRVDANQARE